MKELQTKKKKYSIGTNLFAKIIVQVYLPVTIVLKNVVLTTKKNLGSITILIL